MNKKSVLFYQTRDGLYNLAIKDENNRDVITVNNIRLDKIIELIRKYMDGEDT